MPKVSVIVPVYNVEKFIRRCLISIQQQSLDDIEIIVVNDATPDNSMAIVQELAKDDHRITILNHEKNMGLMWTRRTGYMAATGDYITFCDSDDYLSTNALNILFNEAVRTDADIVSGNYKYIKTNGEIVQQENRLSYGNDTKGVLKSLLQKEFGHNLWGKIYKTSLLQDNILKTYKYVTNGEDGILFYQLLNYVNKVVQIDSSVYFYCQNNESSTQHRYNEKAIWSICLLNKTRFQVVSNFSLLEEDLNRCITNILCLLYAEGYHRDANLRKCIHECNLDDFVSWKNIVKYLDYRRFIRTFVCSIIRSFSPIILL